jgi:hypothetical protein
MREPTRAVRQRAALALALAVAAASALLVLLHTAGAGAHIEAATVDGSPVTFSESNCTKATDPLNIVIYGDTATPEETARHIRHHTPADGSGRGSDQYISSHGKCVPTQAGAKGSNNSEGIYHHRVFQNAGDEYHEPRAVFAPGHHERVVDCGAPKDAVYLDDPEYSGYAGFDAAAARFYDAWNRNGGHRFEYVDEVPHKRKFRQCNDDKIPWNGRILFFSKGNE